MNEIRSAQPEPMLKSDLKFWRLLGPGRLAGTIRDGGPGRWAAVELAWARPAAAVAGTARWTPGGPGQRMAVIVTEDRGRKLQGAATSDSSSVEVAVNQTKRSPG